MYERPWTVTSVAILLILLAGVADLPFFWWYVFPGGKDPGASFIYSGLVLGLLLFSFVIYVAIQFWRGGRWGFWAAIAVAVVHLLGSILGASEVTTSGLRAAYGGLALSAVLILILILQPAVCRRTGGRGTERDA